MTRNSLLIVFLLTCGLATAAFAGPITLTYTGANYNLYSYYPPTANAPYTCTAGDPCYLDITLTLNGPLGDNLSYATVSANTFAFTDGVNTFTNTSAGITADDFVFSTDASGNITNWEAFVQTNGAIGQLLSLNFPGNKVDGTLYSACQGCAQLQYYAYSNGTWAEGPTPSPTPEPGSLALLGTGALGLLGLAWRRSRVGLTQSV